LLSFTPAAITDLMDPPGNWAQQVARRSNLIGRGLLSCPANPERAQTQGIHGGQPLSVLLKS